MISIIKPLCYMVHLKMNYYQLELFINSQQYKNANIANFVLAEQLEIN